MANVCFAELMTLCYYLLLLILEWNSELSNSKLMTLSVFLRWILLHYFNFHTIYKHF